MSVAEVQKEAMKLDDCDRVELVGKILDSLDGADPNDSNDDSLTEARIRGEELRSGKVESIPKGDLFRII